MWAHMMGWVEREMGGRPANCVRFAGTLAPNRQLSRPSVLLAGGWADGGRTLGLTYCVFCFCLTYEMEEVGSCDCREQARPGHFVLEKGESEQCELKAIRGSGKLRR